MKSFDLDLDKYINNDLCVEYLAVSYLEANIILTSFLSMYIEVIVYFK